MAHPVSAEKRSVLITGCSSGIGECVAHGLHQPGYRVFASVRNPGDRAALDGGRHRVSGARLLGIPWTVYPLR